MLDAAEQVFLERGIARATLDDVAQAAGFTRGAVHWHFKDKLGLFNALVGRAWLIEEALAQRVMGNGGPDALRNLGEAIIEALRALDADPHQRRLLTVLRLRCEYTEEMAPALERQQAADVLLLEAMQRAFSDAAAHGRLAVGWDPRLGALAFHALAGGLIDTWLRSGGRAFSLTKDGAAAIEAFLLTVTAVKPAQN